jgi:uncharacterized circularly permuted ATP-grasp superfamily protein
MPSGADVLDKRQERVGACATKTAPPTTPSTTPPVRGTPWALEMIPLPLTAGEWAGLEAGLIQRARCLEQILADTYGPQNPAQGRAGFPRRWSLPTPISCGPATAFNPPATGF